MPPPSCTGTLPPTASTIDLIAASLRGRPATAPFRSTRWMRRAPCSTQWRAVAAGSSENTVSAFMSPCFRRTQRPSFRSMAGMRSIGMVALGSGGGVRGAAARGLPGHAPVTGGGLGLPVNEVLVELQAVGRALLRMELGRENVIPRHRRGKAKPVLGLPDGERGTRRRGVETVDEVEVRPVGHARPDRVRQGLA